MTNAELLAEIERQKCVRHQDRQECRFSDCDDDHELRETLINNLSQIKSALCDVEAAREVLGELVRAAESTPFLSVGIFLEHHSKARSVLAALSEVTP